MTRLLLYIIFLFLCCSPSYSQPGAPLLLLPVTEDNGLSDNHVTCVVKDKEGLVWVGTEDGLNRMDGSSIATFKHKAGDTASIADNGITALKEDSRGNIWIGTAGGVSCYQKAKQRFQNYSFTETGYGGATNIVTALVVNEKVIWVGTDGGLFRLDPITGANHILLCGPDEPANKKKACNKIAQLLQDGTGLLWLGTWEGLWSYNPDRNHFEKRISADNDKDYDPMNLSAFDAGNQLWVGTWAKGLKLFDKRSGAVITYPYPHPISALTGVTQSNGLLTLWLNGMMETFGAATKTFAPQPVSGITVPVINQVYTSADGWLWLCSNSGLYIYNPLRQTFINVSYSKDITSQSLVFAPLDTNYIMGGGGGDILKKYQGHSKEIRDYHDLVFSNFSGNRKAADALSFCRENEQSWWLATSEGIVHINPEKENAKWFTHNDKDSSSLPVNFITHLFIDSKNILWIFPWRKGVWQMDKLTGRCRRLIDGISSRAGLTKGLVIADAAEDSAGNVWMADIDEGIILYERATGHFSKPFEAVIGSAPRTFRIYKQNGYLYSVANTSILKWKDKAHCNIISFPPQTEKYIYDFAPDQQGGWWFATRNGLVYFNEAKNGFKRFTMADGLYSNDLPATLFCKTDGEMIIGGNNFVSSFFPDKIIASSPVIPPLILTQFMANGTRITIDKQEPASLSYNNNNIFISWSLPDYASPFKNQYYCRLQGIDSDWRYVGNRGEVQYASLSPGHYTLLMKGASANGDEATQNLELQFIVNPPFWQRPWFSITVALLLSVLLYFVVSKRIRNIRAKAVVQQQLSELEMKALRAQMNPHFIFNSLNSIQECIVMNNTTAAYDYLSKFSKLVRRILENSSKLFVPLKEEMELLQWYVGLEQLRFKDGVQFTIDAETDIDTDNIMVPSMIIQPYVENALWHGLARKEGEKKLMVSFKKKKEGIECIIADNGIGRQAIADNRGEVNFKKSMGMMITKERLELFNKNARIETFDLLDGTGGSEGTKIVIYLPVE